LVNKYKKALIEIQNKETDIPLDQNCLLPTRFGNILRASEMYPMEKYNLEGLTIWPKLYRILPGNFTRDLEEKNNQMMFMVNSSFLSYALSFFSLLLSFWWYCNHFYANFFLFPNSGNPYVKQATPLAQFSPTRYFVISVLFFVVGYLIYRVGLNAAEDYAITIRSGYDLYRFDLMRQLNIKIPKNLSDERDSWSTLNEFFVAGKRLHYKIATFPPLNSYTLRADLNTSKNRKSSQRKKKGKRK
jgi:hypothetical protein